MKTLLRWAKFVVEIVWFIILLVRLSIFIDSSEIREANRGRYRQKQSPDGQKG